MKISQIYIYPVKSLSGIPVQKSYVTDRGLAYDRRWVLVDEVNVHVTQREHPEMVHLKQAVLENGIKVRNEQSQEAILIPFLPSSIKAEKIQVWDDSFDATEVSNELSTWFSDFLKKEVRLMYQPDESKRNVDELYRVQDKDVVSAADGYPILIISEGSLNDLNARLSEPVEMLRFRPNIVLEGIAAYSEDKLGRLGLGEAEIIGVKNCSRCIMITNKLDGSQRDKEPFKTLANYRRVGGKVLFGRNFLVAKHGKVNVGMEATAL